ncbi:MAG: NUDIX hydrolase [Geminicoccaceae bacterium]
MIAPAHLVNALARVGYRAAFLALRAWWFLGRPEAEGAAVLVWRGAALLLVRTSYRRPLDLPGGGLEPGETPLAGACRELREETGLTAPAAELEALGAVEFEENHRRIRTHLFRWRPAEPVRATADMREIVWIGLVPQAELAAADLGLLVRLTLARDAQLPSGTRQMS